MRRLRLNTIILGLSLLSVFFGVVSCSEGVTLDVCGRRLASGPHRPGDLDPAFLPGVTSIDIRKNEATFVEFSPSCTTGVVLATKPPDLFRISDKIFASDQRLVAAALTGVRQGVGTISISGSVTRSLPFTVR